jgi:hypothetical protein
VCTELPDKIIDETGFLDETWTALGEPETLASCEALGDAINEHGGLFGE